MDESVRADFIRQAQTLFERNQLHGGWLWKTLHDGLMGDNASMRAFYIDSRVKFTGKRQLTTIIRSYFGCFPDAERPLYNSRKYH